MTVSKDYNKHVYDGNGLVTAWPFDFELPSLAGGPDTSVIHAYRTNLRGEVTEVTDFSVDAETGTLTYPLAGPPLAAGEKITILRELPVSQQFFDPSNQGNLYPETLEDNTDRLVMMIQQIDESVSRAVKMGEGYEGEEVTAEGMLEARDIAVAAAATAESCIELAELSIPLSYDAINAAGRAKNSERAAHLSAVSAENWAQTASMLVDGAPAWDVAEEYEFGDAVLYTDGHTYRCVSPIPQTGEDPATSPYWVRLTYTPDNIVETSGSLPYMAKNAFAADGTLWVNSRYGITWDKRKGYATLFRTTTKEASYPDSLYLRTDDPDIQGELIVAGSATIKYDRKRDGMNFYASGKTEATYGGDPIHIDGDTCGDITLEDGVVLAVDDGNLTLSVSGVLEDTPPSVFVSNPTYKELLHIGETQTITNLDIVERDGVSLSVTESAVYSEEFIEDATAEYISFEPGVARIPLLLEVA